LSLSSLAATEYTYNQATVSGTATFVGDEHAALAVLINRVANLIAQRTRRGAGNWAVVSPASLTVLQSATTSAFARTTEGTFEAPTNTKFVGTLNGAMRVFVNSYATDSSPVLVGYKGSSEADAAAFYCPYIPLMSSGVVLDPSTFEPVVSFMTRYGFVELTNTASSFGNAADYVGEIAWTWWPWWSRRRSRWCPWRSPQGRMDPKDQARQTCQARYDCFPRGDLHSLHPNQGGPNRGRILQEQAPI
jgi:hypothetical protein